MRTMMNLAAASVLAAGLAGAAFAADKPAAKTDAAPKCPACKMTLSEKKTKDAPKEVKINGKTYYCCAKCKMDEKKADAPKK